MWDLSAPQPVMEPSPAILDDEVLTSGSPGKSPLDLLLIKSATRQLEMHADCIENQEFYGS